MCECPRLLCMLLWARLYMEWIWLCWWVCNTCSFVCTIMTLHVANKRVLCYPQLRTHVHQILVMKMHAVMMHLVLSPVIVTLDTLGMELHAQVMSPELSSCWSSYMAKYPLVCRPHNCHFWFVPDIDECSATVCTHTHLRCVNAQGSYACCCEQGYTWDGSDCVGKFAIPPGFNIKFLMHVVVKGVHLYLQWKTHVHQILVMKVHVVMMHLVLSLAIVTLDTLGMELHAQVILLDFFSGR